MDCTVARKFVGEDAKVTSVGLKTIVVDIISGKSKPKGKTYRFAQCILLKHAVVEPKSEGRKALVEQKEAPKAPVEQKEAPKQKEAPQEEQPKAQTEEEQPKAQSQTEEEQPKAETEEQPKDKQHALNEALSEEAAEKMAASIFDLEADDLT